LEWCPFTSEFAGIYNRNEEGRSALEDKIKSWPNRKDFLIKLEIWTKSLTQQKRFSDKIGDKVGDMDKIACPVENIFS